MVKTDPDASGFLKALRRTAFLLLAFSLSFGALAGLATSAAGQQAFASPEQAGDALVAAWHGESEKALLKIFGPAGVKLVSSGDLIADKNARDKLAAEYDAKHSVKLIGDEKAILVIGNGEFPYPIPLMKFGNTWRFDTKAGSEEILDRRIGRNELNVIEVCRAYVEAQRDYAAKNPMGNGLREFAMRVGSSAGKYDGLYWPAKEGEDESPLGPLVARAAAEGYGAPGSGNRAPYHGYYYRILTRQGANAPGGASDYVQDGHMTGGFALVAFPAKYGNSGVMTFIVNQDGVLFEKNLGPHTSKIAPQITEFNPDQAWNTP